MGRRRLTGLAAVGLVLALPAGASAATGSWTYSLFGLNQTANSQAEIEVFNASRTTATVTAGIGLNLKQNQTVTAGNWMVVQASCPGPASCAAASEVVSTTPDIQITLTMKLAGNTEYSVFTQNDYSLVGPGGGVSTVLGTLAGAVAIDFGHLSHGQSTLGSDINSLRTTIMGLQQREQTLENQVATLTSDVKALTKLIKKKHRP